MSCGRNRRRPVPWSRANEGTSNKHRSSLEESRPSKKAHQQSSHRRTDAHLGRSSKQTLNDDTIDGDHFRIFDDIGNDVTPRLLTDYAQLSVSYQRDNGKSDTDMIHKRLDESLQGSISAKSVIGATSLSLSASHMMHTGTVFSAGGRTMFDVGTRIVADSEHLLAIAQAERISALGDLYDERPATFLPGFLVASVDPSADAVGLTETDTFFILDLIGDVVSQEDHDEYAAVRQKNQAYIESCQKRRNNDAYADRGMQTFNPSLNHELVMTDPVLMRSEQSWANRWDMHHSFNDAMPLEDPTEGRFPLVYRSKGIDNGEAAKIHNANWHADQERSTKLSMLSGESSKGLLSQSTHGLFSSDSIMKMPPVKGHCSGLNDGIPAKLPEIDVDVFVMERILNLSALYVKQAVHRNDRKSLPVTREEDRRTVVDEGATSSNIEEIQFLPIQRKNVSLERLWHYSCRLTCVRHVSCLCLNERNHNLLAVGYGRFEYNDDREGLVCCWSKKNPEFPERYYQTDAGVTSLSFSVKRPNLLAVGLFNGNICVFDLNHNNTPPMVNTNEYESKHTHPVWQVQWNERERSSDIDNVEILMSISSDGRIKQWILRKELETTDLMCLQPYNASQTACVSLAKGDRIHTAGHFSTFVPGLCFDIWATDRTIYLCGTDDGVIHRCSTIYNEKYLESYLGHTGPVYKLHWSPFVDTVFLSASADWTVRLWMVGHTQSSMVFSSSNSRAFFDAIWSPKSPTMFFCVTVNTIEIWDLNKSTLDPIYVACSPNQLTLTSIAYAMDSDSILVGTSDGAVWTYRLENLSSPTDKTDLVSLVQQNLASQADALDKSDLSHQTSTESL